MCYISLKDSAMRFYPIWLFMILCLLLVGGNASYLHAQQYDTTATSFPVKSLIAPAALATSGLIVQGNISRQLQQRVVDRYPGGINATIDSYITYAPLALSLGLSASGVKGKHPFGEQLLLAVISMVAAQGATTVLKSIAKYPRPSGSESYAFPSGHTTRAFVSATLLHKEYGDQSVWYSVGGYGAATGVGALRVLRNEHWLADVLFGAGVGIGATEIVYWGYPWVKKKLRNRR
jgi:membrane-associated phospholipid phosphatase